MQSKSDIDFSEINEGEIDFPAHIFYICFDTPGIGVPHYYMPAIRLKEAGFKITILSAGRIGAESPDYSLPFAQKEIRSIPPVRFWPKTGFLKKISIHFLFFINIITARLREERNSVFYIQGGPACPAAALALLGLPKKSLIYHTQDYFEPGSHSVFIFFEKHLARRARTVICNEVNRGRFMASNYQLKALPVTIPTALPRSWIEKPPHISFSKRQILLRRYGIHYVRNQILVLHQGPYSSQTRRGESIVHAFSNLPQNYILAFTGCDPSATSPLLNPEFKKYPSLKGRIYFLGKLSYPDLLDITKLFDVGLLLYPNDGVGNFYQAPGRLTQYIGCGLPIVTSRFPGLELLVLKYGLGRAIDPESPEEIAAAIMDQGTMSQKSRNRERLRLREVFETALCYDRSWQMLRQAVLGYKHSS